MREKIHPKWFPEAQVTCLACGTVWTIGATFPEKKVDICSNCHPFYTGEQRIVDTEGQVDRFMKRLQARDQRRVETVGAEDDNGKPAPSHSVETLDIGKRYTQALEEDGLKTLQDVLNRLNDEGDEGIIRISGIGRKVLSDIKKQLRNLGFDVPDVEVTD